MNIYDKTIFGDLEDSNTEYRNEVFDHIGNLSFLCYEIRMNPLPSLRKQYPKFDWKFMSHLGSLGDLLEQIDNADFVWSLGSSRFVLATRKKRASNNSRYFWTKHLFLLCSDHGRTIPDIVQEINEAGFQGLGDLKKDA